MTTRLLTVIAILLCSLRLMALTTFNVERGELDLTQWNPDDKPVVALSGEWKFYWKQLLSAKDLTAARTSSYAQLSIPWSEQIIDGQTLPKNGYATYALTIRLPEHLRTVTFAVPAVFNSYAFLVDDKLICASGKPGTSEETTIPQWRPQTVTVNVEKSTIVVLFQIANFQETRGGCAEVMRIGTSHLSWLDRTYHISGMSLIIFFSLVTAAGILVFYISGTLSFLYLAMLAFAYVIRFLFSDLYFAFDFGIHFPWIVVAKIEYATIPLIVISAAFFISSIYPRDFKPAFVVCFVVCCLLMMVAVVAVPSRLLSPLLVAMQITGLLFCLFVIYAIVRAMTFKRAGAWVSALSVGIFAMVGFYNIYAFIFVLDLNRIVIHAGYALAMALSVVSLVYRTPLRLKKEEDEILRYDDFFNKKYA